MKGKSGFVRRFQAHQNSPRDKFLRKRMIHTYRVRPSFVRVKCRKVTKRSVVEGNYDAMVLFIIAEYVHEEHRMCSLFNSLLHWDHVFEQKSMSGSSEE